MESSANPESLVELRRWNLGLWSWDDSGNGIDAELSWKKDVVRIQLFVKPTSSFFTPFSLPDARSATLC
jgi:hypothetical protein